ncbi:hypothetical protein [Mangrovibacterium lignilyticum]|uniref:hypothetical protein n=1 Tax=Mangrovibacterium lignilyticum TaxID=2668052 RepID=UPI0013D1838F|nr:hypothetical protein [Mangrovibacterium lignilyticum]
MKKFYFIKIRTVLVILFLILNGCDGIFVPDPIDPRIPKYTEDGNNVAGAFINDNIWKSVVTIGFPYSYNQPFINVWQENDSLVLRLNGNTAGESSSIEFHLTGLKISKIEELVTLDGNKIQLDGIKNIGFYIENYTPSSYDNKGIGQIYFKHVGIQDSNVSVEGQTSKIVIISGTFGFSINDSNGEITKVTSGRFDYRITESTNFQTE